MASITTYSTLVQAVIDTAEDDSTEFSNYLPTAIDLAEERLFKELDLYDLETKANGALTINSVTLTKPTGFKYANYFKISVSGSDRILEKKREDYLIDYWPNTTIADVPKYYADYSATEFRITPTPNLGYTYEIKYTKQPTKLSITNSSNYFIEQCKDALFAATMVEQTRFMKAWSQVGVWEDAYTKARDSWNINSQRQKRDDGQKPQNPQGPNDLNNAVKG